MQYVVLICLLRRKEFQISQWYQIQQMRKPGKSIASQWISLIHQDNTTFLSVVNHYSNILYISLNYITQIPPVTGVPVCTADIALCFWFALPCPGHIAHPCALAYVTTAQHFTGIRVCARILTVGTIWRQVYENMHTGISSMYMVTSSVTWARLRKLHVQTVNDVIRTMP